MGLASAIFAFLNVLVLVVADNYFIVFPPVTGSQTVALAAAATAMLERNHKVTLIVAEDFKDNVRKHMKNDKYTLESFKSSVTLPVFREIQTGMTRNALKGDYNEMINILTRSAIKEIFHQVCDDLFADQHLVKKLEQEKFDLVFAHAVMACPVLLAQHLDVPFPPETGSQTVALAAAATAMLDRNHTVTLIVANDFKDNVIKRMQNDKYTLESFKSSVTLPVFRDIQTGMTGNALKGDYNEMINILTRSAIKEIFHQVCDDLFADQHLVKKLEQEKFDLVFAHAVMACPVLLAQHLDVPFVSFIPVIPPSLFLRLNANPVNTAVNPEMPTGFSDRMTFLQRVKNTIVSGKQWMMVDTPFNGFDQLKQKYNIKPEMSMLESLTHAEIVFVLSHFALDFPRAYQPNVVSVGGLSATRPKPLPKDLEDFMQSSGDAGVIIFSMGSYINTMETEMADMFAEAFAKLPQKVIWKSAGQPPSFTPLNVKMSKWLPQNDILGHPKTRAMIYHCGNNGVFEAIYHAVPVICIPVFADQWDDAKRLEVKGVGLQLDLFTLTSDKVVEAVETIVTGKSYQTNMPRISAIFHDEPLPAPQRVVYWMEKVVRHRGMSHLRTAAFDLNTIQYNLLDVIAFIALIAIIVTSLAIYISILFCRCLCGCCKGRRKQKEE
ncbi:UDP-glucuronosyltransferase 2C1-like [Amphiura filiformis]|uniref:UDP-glucuronosyltransferase 2C1-like n=1 Tax=Amphiura filiformis TaxID=82378 RepID=UPI003B22031E